MSRLPHDSDSVAVVGMSCRFPGSPDVASFWRGLRGGVEALTTLTEDDLVASGIDRHRFEDPLYVRAGMCLEALDQFDADLFGLGEREAAHLDPQQRLLLECAWEALEDAGRAPGIASETIGVYAGARLSDYLQSRHEPIDLFGHGAEPPAVHFQRLLANDKDYVANRLAYTLDLCGPALSVQTACSTSLVAVHLACQSLLDGECDLALAGGASVRLPQRAGYLCSEGMIYSPDGHTRAFDARAAGTVFGSGAGMVALRRLPDARASGDRVLAIVRGSAVNNDGGSDKASFTAPSPRGQAEVIRTALAAAEIAPTELSYLEAHGTATPIGDAVEVGALKEVFGDAEPLERCVLGSVKTNLGHLVQAAGIAGLIKTVLMLQHREFVPSLHFETANPALGLERSPFVVGTTTTPWDSTGSPRRAGVGSYGFGGTNAYVVLEESGEEATSDPPRSASILTVSAKTRRALVDLVERTATAMDGVSPVDLADAAHTSQVGRRHFVHRSAVVGSSGADVARQLRARASKTRPREDGAPRLAFAFTGQGVALHGVGRELLDLYPAFGHSLERSQEILEGEIDLPLASLLLGEDPSVLDDQGHFQPTWVALQIALAELYASWGVHPDLTIGHSLGELTAAWASGALGRREVLRLAAARGRAIARTPRGAMVAIGAPLELATELIADSEGELELAAANGRDRFVLSGTEAGCERALAGLSSRGIPAQRLPTRHAFHSQQVEPVLDELRRRTDSLANAPLDRPLVTTWTGCAIEPGEMLAAGHWPRHAREPVRFDKARETLAGRADIVLEIGPTPVLSALAATDELPWETTLGRVADESRAISLALASLYERGVDVDWQAFAQATGTVRKRIALPTYPFQRRRHWLERRPRDIGASERPPGGLRRVHPLLGSRTPSDGETARFRSDLSAADEPFLRDHAIYDRLPFLATGYLEIALAAAHEAEPGAGPTTIEELAIARSLLLEVDRHHDLRTELAPGRDGWFSLELSSSQDGGNSWVENVRASVARRGEHPESTDSLERIAARCTTSISAQANLAEKARRGANLGPSLQMIREIWVGAGELLARAELPVGLGEGADAYRAHPVLVDACMQLGAVVHAKSDESDDLFLPTAIDRFSSFESLPNEVWCHLRQGPAVPRELYTIDFDLRDESGKILASARGVSFKRARRDALARSAPTETRSGSNYDLRWLAAAQEDEHGEEPNRTVPVPSVWWLCGDGVLCERLESRLGAAGSYARVINPAELEDAGACARVLADTVDLCADGLPFAGALYLPAAEVPAEGDEAVWADPTRASRWSAGALGLAQLLAERPGGSPSTQLWLVTRGAQATGFETGPIAPAAATLWGLGRVIQEEEPEIDCRLVDVAPSTTEPDDELLLAELAAPNPEPLVALRRGRRLKPELRRSPVLASVDTEEDSPSMDGRVVVAAPERGLEGLTLSRLDRRPPGAGEVEIRVVATGLNFRDALNASGRLQGPLGWECSGIVVEAGPGVERLASGDRVLALAPNVLREYVTVDVRRVAPIPSHLGFRAAATLPAAFLTSIYGLCELAQIRAGQRVLIHTGAGGVGHAAVQVARRAQAEIFVTASRPKWAYLRSLGLDRIMDSRVPGFSRRLLEETDGEGVDIVLNTLAGPFVEESLSVLSPGGHFIELGHPEMGVWSVERLMAERPDIRAHHFRLSEDVGERDPERLHRMLRSMAEDLKSGTLRPLPFRAEPIERLSAALEEQLSGHSVGKLAVDWRGPNATEASNRIRSDATYLITGGTGALGRRIAKRLAEEGARQLVLVSRNASHKPPPEIGVDGAAVRLLSADLSDRREVQSVLHEIRATMPPLRGVVHATGVLDDGLVRAQNQLRLERVFAPKVDAAFYLHELTSDLPLDFFVSFSSVAVLSGNPGQSTYAAANAYLDALAHLRRSLGLAATSINWGPWAETGMAAEVAEQRRRRAEQSGVRDLAPDLALDAFVRALTNETPQTVVAELDLSRFPLGRRARARDRAERSLGDRRRSARTRDDVLEVVVGEIERQGGSARGPGTESKTLRDLGLDSLAVLLLRGRILARLGDGVSTPVATFLADPTVGDLTDALASEIDPRPADFDRADSRTDLPVSTVTTSSVAASASPLAPDDERDSGAPSATVRHDLRQRIAEATAGWTAPHERSGGLLLPGAAAAAGKTPLFWCLQGENELRALREVLADRPFWAMRSGHLLMETSIENIRTLADLYAEEVAEIADGAPVVLGGNCQGSVIAFLIAQRLWSEGVPVTRLCMLENRVPKVLQDVYPGRVALIYGTESDHVYHPFKRYLSPERGWKRLYPNGYTLDFIPGAHGSFFAAPAILPLGRLLSDILSEADEGAAERDAIARLRRGQIQVRAEIGGDRPHEEMASTVVVRLSLHNRGPGDWICPASAGIIAAGHWLDAEGEVISWAEGARTVETTVPPDRTTDLEIEIVPPPSARPATLRVGLAEDGVDWLLSTDCAWQDVAALVAPERSA